MNSKHYIGKRVSSLEFYDDVGPVTGVALLVDDENEIFAGDETGYVIEIDCPYATQTMANDVLASLTGRTYKGFRGTGAGLDPLAELGDGITIGGEYTFLANRVVNFGAGHRSEISAPGENALVHEFSYQSPTQRETKHRDAVTRSLISKTAEEIRLEVFGENGLQASINVSLKAITDSITGIDGRVTSTELTLGGFVVTTTDEDGNTKFVRLADGVVTADAIKAGAVTADKIAAGAITAEKIAANSITAEKLNITGAITFDDLDDDTQEKINSAGGLDLDEVTTVITETLVQSPTIKGGSIIGGTLYAEDEDYYLEITGSGFELWGTGIYDTKPKFQLQYNDDLSYVRFMLGAGSEINQYSDKGRFLIEKDSDAACIWYFSETSGDAVGFSFFNDGTIKVFGTLVDADGNALIGG